MSRISRDEQGAYHWAGTVDAGYEQKSFRIAFGVVGGICVLLLVMSIAMGGEMLRVTLLSCLGALAVTGGVCLLFRRHAGTRLQRYILTEDAIHFCMRRGSNPFLFRNTRKAVIFPGRNMIELYQPFASGPIFVPPEDFAFVRDYILQRIPEDAEIVYE